MTSWIELFIEFFKSGGFTMYPLLLCSFIVWGIIFERILKYRKLGQDLKDFHFEALNTILKKDLSGVKRLCEKRPLVPSSQILQAAVERLGEKDRRLKARWIEAAERKRQLVNLDLKRYLWVLGTIASAAPFIGLGGTVVGILRSFHEMARTGSGGFAVVASGISESLVATAAGIIVAVVSVLAYNAFLNRWASLVLLIKIQSEEWVELLSGDLADGA